MDRVFLIKGETGQTFAMELSNLGNILIGVFLNIFSWHLNPNIWDFKTIIVNMLNCTPPPPPPPHPRISLVLVVIKHEHVKVQLCIWGLQ